MILRKLRVVDDRHLPFWTFWTSARCNFWSSDDPQPVRPTRAAARAGSSRPRFAVVRRFMIAPAFEGPADAHGQAAGGGTGIQASYQGE